MELKIKMENKEHAEIYGLLLELAESLGATATITDKINAEITKAEAKET